MLPWLATLSPNAAVLVLMVGLALIAVELNRPGYILPGAAGLLVSLLACASLTAHHPSIEAVLWTVTFVILLMWNMRRRHKAAWMAAIAFTCGLVLAIGHLLPPGRGAQIHPWAALASGLVLGAGTTVLTQIARRARQNKGLD